MKVKFVIVQYFCTYNSDYSEIVPQSVLREFPTELIREATYDEYFKVCKFCDLKSDGNEIFKAVQIVENAVKDNDWTTKGIITEIDRMEKQAEEARKKAEQKRKEAATKKKATEAAKAKLNSLTQAEIDVLLEQIKK